MRGSAPRPILALCAAQNNIHKEKEKKMVIRILNKDGDLKTEFDVLSDPDQALRAQSQFEELLGHGHLMVAVSGDNKEMATEFDTDVQEYIACAPLIGG